MSATLPVTARSTRPEHTKRTEPAEHAVRTTSTPRVTARVGGGPVTRPHLHLAAPVAHAATRPVTARIAVPVAAAADADATNAADAANAAGQRVGRVDQPGRSDAAVRSDLLGEAGASTAEYATVTGCGVGFAALLFKFLTSDMGQELLRLIFTAIKSLLPF